MGVCGSRAAVPSVPPPDSEKTQSKTQSLQSTPPQIQTPTPSSKHSTAVSARRHAQSHGAAFSHSQRRHEDGRDYPPPSSGAMYSPHNIQIPRKFRTHHRNRLVEGIGRRLRPYLALDTKALSLNPCQVCPPRQAKFQLGDGEADHVSLSLCRAYFLMTSGMQSDVVLSVQDNSAALSIDSEFSLWERCPLSIRQILGGTDAYFIAARLWQVLTHQNHFQSGHVGLYPIIFALLPHQLTKF